MKTHLVHRRADKTCLHAQGGEFFQYGAPEGIRADPSHIRRWHAQFVRRYERRCAGAASLDFGFKRLQLCILKRVFRHDDQGVMDGGAYAHEFRP